jgi:hypothetical protein
MNNDASILFCSSFFSSKKKKKKKKGENLFTISTAQIILTLELN